MSPGGRGGRAPPLAVPASVLVVVTRRRGDVLLASPLIRSLKAAWPQAGIDVLVFAGTQGVLEANPDVRRVITVAERPGLFAHLALAARLLRRYDIALSCLAGDRPTAYAVVAGRWRVGMVGSGSGARWKRRVLSKAIAFDDLDTHTAAMNLAFAEVLGIARHHEISIGWTTQDAARASALLGERTRASPYVVLHVHPKFNYKMWHVEGWVGLAHWLGERGYRHGPHGWRRAGRKGIRGDRRGAHAPGRGQSGGATHHCADSVRHCRGAPFRRTRHGDDAHGGGAGRAHGGVVRPVQSRQMGALAATIRWRTVALAACGHAGNGQRPAGSGSRRLRSLHGGRLRSARRELFGLPATVAVACGHRGGGARARRARRIAPAHRAFARHRSLTSARFAPSWPPRQREQECAGDRGPDQEHRVRETVEVQQVAVGSVEEPDRRARKQEVRQQQGGEQR